MVLTKMQDKNWLYNRNLIYCLGIFIGYLDFWKIKHINYYVYIFKIKIDDIIKCVKITISKRN